MEINLLKNYPQSKRAVEERAAKKTDDVRQIARKFGKDYFDGDRLYGYGGYSYNPRFWQPVIPDFQSHYGLTAESSILDVGCGKGFLLHDFLELIPGISVEGIDISPYAISHALSDVLPYLRQGDAKELPYPDRHFDLVIAINVVHNLPLEECKQALREIMRVSRGQAFLTVDAYRTEEEKKRMDDWNLTALTYMHVDAWKQLFEDVGYTGDYWWFIP